ncbi:MAG: signal peptidase I [Firmicutes bacterium]|nr:signal peptidase I [Bacillota bacterium]
MPFLALGLALAPLSVLHPVRVSGHSMEPTLKQGQRCWVLRAWVAGSPKLGDIWVIDGPEGPSIKRVVGLSQQAVEWREGLVVREGRQSAEPYVRALDLDSCGMFPVGEGYVFMGDNRRQSRDSRTWGRLPATALRGRVLGP